MPLLSVFTLWYVQYVEYLPALADAMHARYMQDLRRGFNVYLNVVRSLKNPESIRQVCPVLACIEIS